MEPFYFRKIETAYLGCRDGISQAAAVWHKKGYLLDCMCREEPHRHIFDLLGWRYAKPTSSANFSSGEASEEEQAVEPLRGLSASQNPIDRAVWPTEYKHIHHYLLHYKQPADQPTDA
ncbi:hypothetical protein FRC10_002895 [Ceratobasidium sp. 414]|nr:hypothetical protein FRC10_002895 [Ceratobasidium sp. 414]